MRARVYLLLIYWSLQQTEAFPYIYSHRNYVLIPVFFLSEKPFFSLAAGIFFLLQEKIFTSCKERKKTLRQVNIVLSLQYQEKNSWHPKKICKRYWKVGQGGTQGWVNATVKKCELERREERPLLRILCDEPDEEKPHMINTCVARVRNPKGRRRAASALQRQNTRCVKTPAFKVMEMLPLTQHASFHWSPLAHSGHLHPKPHIFKENPRIDNENLRENEKWGKNPS